MAKKKKKYLITLNNKIQNYFNEQPFYEVIELIMLPKITMPSHTHEEMIRMLRPVWSECTKCMRNKLSLYTKILSQNSSRGNLLILIKAVKTISR